MALDAAGKAYSRVEGAEWSPADGDFIRHCPAGALSVSTMGLARRPSHYGDEAA